MTPDRTLIKLTVDTAQVAAVLEAVRTAGIGKHHVTVTDPEPETAPIDTPGGQDA